MLEWIKLDTPPFFPHHCATCKGGNGPVWDTHVEMPGGVGRLYVCDRCLGNAARLAGYAEGKKMDQLLEASALVTKYEREMDRMRVESAALGKQLRDEKAANKDMSERLEQSNLRNKQLAQQLAKHAEENLDLIGGR